MNQESFIAVARERGFTFIGPVTNIRTKTQWKCAEGHQWLQTYTNVRRGSGCPTCANKNRSRNVTSKKWLNNDAPAPNQSLSANDYRNAALSVGIEWAGKVAPISTKLETSWRCAKGHEWNAPYTNIVFSSSGCPTCAIEASRLGEDDYYRQGLRSGFEFLGPLPTGIQVQTWWKCASGHPLKKSLKSIRQGTGCPVCKKLLSFSTRDSQNTKIILCKSAETFDSLIEADAFMEYVNEVGCCASCKNEHHVERINV